jgi:hypothetical protein
MAPIAAAANNQVQGFHGAADHVRKLAEPDDVSEDEDEPQSHRNRKRSHRSHILRSGITTVSVFSVKELLTSHHHD